MTSFNDKELFTLIENKGVAKPEKRTFIDSLGQSYTVISEGIQTDESWIEYIDEYSNIINDTPTDFNSKSGEGDLECENKKILEKLKWYNKVNVPDVGKRKTNATAASGKKNHNRPGSTQGRISAFVSGPSRKTNLRLSRSSLTGSHQCSRKKSEVDSYVKKLIKNTDRSDPNTKYLQDNSEAELEKTIEKELYLRKKGHKKQQKNDSVRMKTTDHVVTDDSENVSKSDGSSDENQVVEAYSRIHDAYVKDDRNLDSASQYSGSNEDPYMEEEEADDFESDLDSKFDYAGRLKSTLRDPRKKKGKKNQDLDNQPSGYRTSYDMGIHATENFKKLLEFSKAMRAENKLEQLQSNYHNLQETNNSFGGRNMNRTKSHFENFKRQTRGSAMRHLHNYSAKRMRVLLDAQMDEVIIRDDDSRAQQANATSIKHQISSTEDENEIDQVKIETNAAAPGNPRISVCTMAPRLTKAERLEAENQNWLMARRPSKRPTVGPDQLANLQDLNSFTASRLGVQNQEISVSRKNSYNPNASFLNFETLDEVSEGGSSYQDKIDPEHPYGLDWEQNANYRNSDSDATDQRKSSASGNSFQNCKISDENENDRNPEPPSASNSRLSVVIPPKIDYAELKQAAEKRVQEAKEKREKSILKPLKFDKKMQEALMKTSLPRESPIKKNRRRSKSTAASGTRPSVMINGLESHHVGLEREASVFDTNAFDAPRKTIPNGHRKSIAMIAAGRKSIRNQNNKNAKNSQNYGFEEEEENDDEAYDAFEGDNFGGHQNLSKDNNNQYDMMRGFHDRKPKINGKETNFDRGTDLEGKNSNVSMMSMIRTNKTNQLIQFNLSNSANKKWIKEPSDPNFVKDSKAKNDEDLSSIPLYLLLAHMDGNLDKIISETKNAGRRHKGDKLQERMKQWNSTARETQMGLGRGAMSRKASVGDLKAFHLHHRGSRRESSMFLPLRRPIMQHPGDRLNHLLRNMKNFKRLDGFQHEDPNITMAYKIEYYHKLEISNNNLVNNKKLFEKCLEKRRKCIPNFKFDPMQTLTISRKSAKYFTTIFYYPNNKGSYGKSKGTIALIAFRSHDAEENVVFHAFDKDTGRCILSGDSNHNVTFGDFYFNCKNHNLYDNRSSRACNALFSDKTCLKISDWFNIRYVKKGQCSLKENSLVVTFFNRVKLDYEQHVTNTFQSINRQLVIEIPKIKSNLSAGDNLGSTDMTINKTLKEPIDDIRNSRHFNPSYKNLDNTAFETFLRHIRKKISTVVKNSNDALRAMKIQNELSSINVRQDLLKAQTRLKSKIYVPVTSRSPKKLSKSVKASQDKRKLSQIPESNNSTMSMKVITSRPTRTTVRNSKFTPTTENATRKSEISSRKSHAQTLKNRKSSTATTTRFSTSSRGSVGFYNNNLKTQNSVCSVRSTNSRLLPKRLTNTMTPIRTNRNGTHSISNKYHPALKIRIENNLSLESLHNNNNNLINHPKNRLSNERQKSISGIKIDASDSAEKLNQELRGTLTHKQTWDSQYYLNMINKR